MDFDFIRYKARVLQTTSFNVLLFSVDIDIQSQIQVRAFKAGSKPFVVVWASSLQVAAIAKALTSKHIAVEITLESAIDVIAVALTALHIAVPMAESMEIDVTGRVCSVVPVEVDSIDALLALITAMNTPTSIHTQVILSNAVDLVATLRACGYTEARVQLTAALIASLTLRPDTPIDIKTNTKDTLDLTVDVKTGNTVEMAVGSTNNLDLTVVVSPDGAVAIFAPGEYELTASANIALDSSKAINSDAESSGVVTVVVRLLGFATLSEYDADMLSDLDTMSLQSMAYIEI